MNSTSCVAAKHSALIADVPIPVPELSVDRDLLMDLAGLPRDVNLFRDRNSPSDELIEPGACIDLRDGNVFYVSNECGRVAAACEDASPKYAYFVNDQWQIVLADEFRVDSLRSLFKIPNEMQLVRDLMSPVDLPIPATDVVQFSDGAVFITLPNPPTATELPNELEDIELCCREERKPRCVRRYRIRIDKEQHVVNVTQMTGRQLLEVAGKTDVRHWEIFQKLRGGKVEKIRLDESVDFTSPGIEKFKTLPLDQTEGAK